MTFVDIVCVGRETANTENHRLGDMCKNSALWIIRPSHLCISANFYPRDAMLARVLAVVVCLSAYLCVSRIIKLRTLSYEKVKNGVLWSTIRNTWLRLIHTHPAATCKMWTVILRTKWSIVIILQNREITISPQRIDWYGRNLDWCEI